MNRVSFAYVVQLNLPGLPVKIGHTSRPRDRIAQFEQGTPCDLRIVGLTLNGKAREADMLAATKAQRIRGEWRYPNAELAAMISQYFLSGEWFVPAADHQAHFDKTDVAARVERHMAHSYPIRAASQAYHWASLVLGLAKSEDPLLGLDWAGFTRATTAPSLIWPQTKVIAA